MTSIRFRYVQCQIDLLSAQRTGKDVLRALNTMPDSLNGTYEAALSRISPYDRNLAREALLWLTYSWKPITLSALSEALVVEKGDSLLDDQSRLFDPNVILHICQGLVVYDEDTSTVTLAHSSVRDFLTSAVIRRGPASFYSLQEVEGVRCIYRKCLTYLMFDEFCRPCPDNRYLDQRLVDFPLLEYAALTWAQYCGNRAPPGFELTESELNEIMDFFDTYTLKSGANYVSWVQVIRSEATEDTVWTTEPLYYAASFGILPAVDTLIRRGANVDSCGGRNSATALNIASFRGCYSVVKRLLQAGADPNTKDRADMTSIEWAKEFERRRIIELLLEYGAEDRLSPPPVIMDLNPPLWICCSCEFANNGTLTAGRCANCGHISCISCASMS